MTPEERTREDFLSSLKALMKSYGAVMEAEDHYPGYAECGQDIRIEVTIPTRYDRDGEVVTAGCTIDLGSSFEAEDE